MPRYWHDRHSIGNADCDRELNYAIVADRKPYFMTYIYPELRHEYNRNSKQVNDQVEMLFRMPLEQMRALPFCKLTEEQQRYLYYLDESLNVGTGNCVVNRVCRLIEDTFAGCLSRQNQNASFDSSIMKSGRQYSNRMYYLLKEEFDEYNEKMQNIAIRRNIDRQAKQDCSADVIMINSEFRSRAQIICPDEDRLCDILVDLCYKSSSTKKYLWAVCPDMVIRNLLNKNDNLISFPTLSEDGDILYNGMTFEVKTVKVERKDD